MNVCSSSFLQAYCSSGRALCSQGIFAMAKSIIVIFKRVACSLPFYQSALQVMLCLFFADRFFEGAAMTTRVRDIEVRAGPTGTLLRFMWYKKNSPMAPEVELAGAIVRINLPRFSHSQVRLTGGGLQRAV